MINLCSRLALFCLLCCCLQHCGSVDRKIGWEVLNPKNLLTKKQQRELKKQARAAWSKRHLKSELLKAIDAYESLASSSPNDKETLVYLTRSYYLLADAHTDEEEKKMELWEIGAMWGDRAMATDETFNRMVRSGEKITDAINTLGRDYVPAIYWTAANLGKWAKLSSVTTQLKLKAQITTMIERIQALAPDYFHGAIYRYWGAYYAVAPGFAGGSMAKSKKNFKLAFEQAPEYLGSFVLYAEAYATRQGDKKDFVRKLNYVLKREIEKNSDIRAENIIEKRKAKKMLDRMEQFF